MNFIVYGNEDSPVVPILLYEPGKVTYVIGEDERGGGEKFHLKENFVGRGPAGGIMHADC